MNSYVTVKEDSEEKLHLGRDPGQRAWAILLGLIAFGLGAAFYSNDYLLWKIAYISGSVFVGLNCMEDWEECIFDKAAGTMTVMRQSLVQRLFQTKSGARITTVELSEAVSVTVDSEEVKYAGNSYSVVVHFAPGYSVGITETATIGDKSEHEAIANKISKFLMLQDQENIQTANAKEETHQDEKDSSSSSDGDSFEQIDKEDLIDAPDDVDQ